MTNEVCRGDWILGSSCGQCYRCVVGLIKLIDKLKDGGDLESRQVAKKIVKGWKSRDNREFSGSLPDELRRCGVASERSTNKPAHTLAEENEALRDELDRREQSWQDGHRVQEIRHAEELQKLRWSIEAEVNRLKSAITLAMCQHMQPRQILTDKEVAERMRSILRDVM